MAGDNVRTSGPLFDGRAQIAFDDLLDKMPREVARVGAADVRLHLAGVLRHPTGYYESRIDYGPFTRAGTEAVHDSGVVYGPWLEGTGSRNRTTRFKGYHTFRIVRQALNRKVPEIVQPLVDRFLARAN